MTSTERESEQAPALRDGVRFVQLVADQMQPPVALAPWQLRLAAAILSDPLRVGLIERPRPTRTRFDCPDLGAPGRGR